MHIAAGLGEQVVPEHRAARASTASGIDEHHVHGQGIDGTLQHQVREGSIRRRSSEFPGPAATATQSARGVTS